MKCKRCHKRESMLEYSICKECFGKKIRGENEGENKRKK